MDHYEYRRYQTGATPFFPPFRFPGQYHDTDTDFFENWNRYYDPQTGRYLQPEPLLHSPGFAVAMAKLGRSTPTYSYALNNPIGVVDSTGLAPSFDSPSAARTELARAILTGNWNRAAEIATFLGGAAPVAVTRLQQAYDAANRTAGPCFTVAKNIYDGFKAAGIEAELRFIRTGRESGSGARIGRLVGEKWEIVSTHGIHAVVESGGKYFDAFTGPAGQKASQYMTQMAPGMPASFPLVVQ